MAGRWDDQVDEKAVERERRYQEYHARKAAAGVTSNAPMQKPPAPMGGNAPTVNGRDPSSKFMRAYEHNAREADASTKTYGTTGSPDAAVAARMQRIYGTTGGITTAQPTMSAAPGAQAVSPTAPQPTPSAPAMVDFSNGGRSRYDTSIPASVRHNNPGAMYPAPWMSKYGMQGHSIIGGGHKIAYFPDAISGAAANFDLFERGYVGKTLGGAINKWSGSNSPGAYAKSVASKLGVSPETVITRDMLRDPKFGPGMMSAMAAWEKGPKGQQFSLSPEQWQSAHSKFIGGNQSSPAPGVSASPAQSPQQMPDSQIAPPPPGASPQQPQMGQGWRDQPPRPAPGASPSPVAQPQQQNGGAQWVNGTYGPGIQWSNGDTSFTRGPGNFAAGTLTDKPKPAPGVSAPQPQQQMPQAGAQPANGVDKFQQWQKMFGMGAPGANAPKPVNFGSMFKGLFGG